MPFKTLLNCQNPDGARDMSITPNRRDLRNILYDPVLFVVASNKERHSHGRQKRNDRTILFLTL
jgi:hypothetical protein